MSDPELFAIEAWMRRQGITGTNEADREAIAKRILWRMRLEQMDRVNRQYFGDTVCPRGLVPDE